MMMPFVRGSWYWSPNQMDYSSQVVAKAEVSFGSEIKNLAAELQPKQTSTSHLE
eukprot:CAMPEP_0116887500 /NCGR_PEP_ID=MMETSP0463-20121206/22020_1 /TAXON_ID=181622 /ORGANISM="Strombidinopsis sp, Strain SopsisLIS2011" /LENGTH=53 /DNA_ID=CAMNT_0004550323 /DNA_START=1470 /DNA_END=1631 /DNA_ORIENTATION=-